MGRYVGNKWHEELPSTSPADQTQGNNEPVNNAPSQRGGGGDSGFVAPATGGGGGGSAGFWTKNGYQTVATMAQQLRNVGWAGDPGDAVSVIDAYRRTTGGDVTDTNPGGAGNPNGGAPGAPGAPGTPAPQPAEFFNNQAEQLKLTAAQQAAYQAYLNERLRTIDQPGLELQKEQLAFQKATEAFNETMKTAEVTGQFNGQQTEAAKEFARKQALEEAQAAGIWNGQPTEQAREFNVGQQNQVATALLNLLGTLRGPESAFQQQAVINGMDSSGMSNAVKALLGRMNQPLSQGNQANPVPVSLESLFRQALGGGANGFTAPNSVPGAGGTGGNFLASLPAGSMPNLSNIGDITRSLKGQGGDTSNMGFSVMDSAGGAGGTGGGGGTSDVANLYANNLPAPNQIVGRNFLRMDPDTQNFLMSAYNAAGYGTPQVQSAIKAGLPQFSAPKTGTLIY